MIVLDTSVLIDGLTGGKRSGPAIRGSLAEGEQILVPALVLFEWLRGPRLREELAAQEAALSADLYRAVVRPRGLEIDLAIAACSILREAPLWTFNRADFRDLPGIRLYGSR